MNNVTKIIFIISLAVCLAAGAGSAALLYTTNKIERESTLLKQEVAKAEAQRRDLAALVRLAESIDEEVTELNSYLIKNEDEVIDFLNLLDTLASESRLEITVKSTEANSINGSFEDFTINFSVLGSYNNVLQFLTLIEALPYQVLVSEVSFSSNVEGAWNAEIHLHVTKYKTHE